MEGFVQVRKGRSMHGKKKKKLAGISPSQLINCLTLQLRLCPVMEGNRFLFPHQTSKFCCVCQSSRDVLYIY